MNLTASLRHQVWAITREGMRSLSARYEATGSLIERGLASLSNDERARICYNGGNPIVHEIANGVATIEVMGDLVARAPWWAKAYLGAIDPFDLADVFDALAIDTAVTALVIEVDCCGGTVAGTFEARDALARFQAAGKTVEVRAAGVIASAAYAMFAGADRIIATPTTTVGSLGTMVVLTDDSVHLATCGIKLEVISTGPLKGLGQDGAITQAMRDQYQRYVDQLNLVFKDAVAAGRGIANVDPLFSGDFWIGAEALSLGLIDAVASLADEVDPAAGNAPAPIPVAPPLAGGEGPQSHLTPPAAAGTSQEGSHMDPTLQAALAALSDSHPTHAHALLKEALKPGATAADLRSFAAGLESKALSTEVATLRTQLDAAAAKATTAAEAHTKALAEKDKEIARLKALAGIAEQAPRDVGGDPTGGITQRKIPLSHQSKMTAADHADLKAGRAILVDDTPPRSSDPFKN